MNSTPNIKAVNGKAESSDSGAESEEEGLREEEEKELQQNVKGMFHTLRPVSLGNTSENTSLVCKWWSSGTGCSDRFNLLGDT